MTQKFPPLDKAHYAPARARLRALRDRGAASLAGTDPLASALLARAAVVLGLLNQEPTFFVCPPADGFVIIEGFLPSDLRAGSIDGMADEELVRRMAGWAKAAVARGLVLSDT